MAERGHEQAAFREPDVELLEHYLESGVSITKGQAKVSWSIPDRRFRAAISELRRRGYPVVSFSEAEHGGYRRANDGLEVIRFVELELESRADELMLRARAMRAAIPAHYGPQQRLFEENGEGGAIGDPGDPTQNGEGVPT